MKWAAHQLKSALNQPASLPPFILLYGDDAGAIHQHTQALIEATGIDLNDPFAADKIDVTDLQETPSRLAEAAGTVSLMGGQRLILVQGVNGDCAKNQLDATLTAVKGVLSTELQDTLILLPAPHISKDAALVKNVEKHTKAAAVRHFQENIRDMGAYATDILRQANKTATPDARALLTENLGADKEITRRELEKLILYVGEQEQITADDVVASLSDAPAVNIFKLCDAIGQRDLKTVETWVDALLQEGEDPNTLLSLAVRHLRRVLQVKEGLASGMNENEALRLPTPPITFGKDVFMAQVRKASLPRLQHVVPRALEAQFQTRDLAIPVELHLKRTLLALTA